MKILVVGSGGREHAIAWKIRQSPLLSQLYCAPGNPGTAQLGKNAPISAEDTQSLLAFARDQQIDLTVVGPEAPLVAGLVDLFQEAGLLAFGPSKAAARLEGSKVFAKDFMSRHGIPTAAHRSYQEADAAEADLEAKLFGFPLVVKADGLAAGKGVLVCPDKASALEAIDTVMRRREFGPAGDRLILEEFLRGEEVSFMVFSDGIRFFPMAPSQDHKAVYDGDRGPNTGGMGAYSTDAILDAATRQLILKEIIEPTISGMAQEGSPYRGVLYAGLMMTPSGPRVLEYNVRFGDPETQVVLPRLESDLVPILLAAARGDLRGIDIRWNNQAAVCVVAASAGYPGHYDKGKQIAGLEMVRELKNVVAFHAGTTEQDGRIATSGGRVLGLTAQAGFLEEAILRAYEGINAVHFEGMYYRRDIAAKGLRKIQGR